MVLIDIQEDEKALEAHRKTKDFLVRFRRLLLNYAQEDAIEKLGVEDYFGERYGYLSDSEPEDYLDVQNELVKHGKSRDLFVLLFYSKLFLSLGPFYSISGQLHSTVYSRSLQVYINNRVPGFISTLYKTV